MKEIPLSSCEREFVLTAINERKRLDGREVYDYRRIQITFGIDRGCCQVTIGNTRVLAQVSSEVTTPKQARPSEGMLFVNVELSPMASATFEAGRQSEESVELNRLLERCLKESRCVDTESLCIKSGLKVWQIRCDVHVLNQDGNMLDCASIAAISALAHFRRPDVTVSGEDITIHSMEDRDPIPLSVHHMPLCVTFAFYHQGKFLLIDPALPEEKVMEGKLVVGMNKHREVCTLQMTGSMLLLKDQVLRCSNIAVVKVTEITQLIQEALQNDAKARSEGKKFGFAASVEPKKLTTLARTPESFSDEGTEEIASAVVNYSYSLSEAEDESDDSSAAIHKLGRGTASIGLGGSNAWDLDKGEEEDMMEELAQEKKETKVVPESDSRVAPEIYVLSGDSEEEETVQLENESVSIKKNRSQTDIIDLTQALKGSRPKKKKSKTPKM